MSWFAKTGQRWTRPAGGAPTQFRPAGTGGVDRWVHPKPVYQRQVRCLLYLIYVYDPRTNFTTTTLGYVGETSRTDPFGEVDVRIRFMQHLMDQPWSDTIPEQDPNRALETGVLQVLNATFKSKKDVWKVEEQTIHRLRPLYNHEYNQNNPDRITIPEARQARAQRDRAAGLPPHQTWAVLYQQRKGRPVDAPCGWNSPTPVPASRVPVGLLYRWAARLRGMSRLGRRRLRRGVVWLAGWLVLWWLAARYVQVVPTVRMGGACAALSALVLVVWARPRRGVWRQAGNQILRLALLVLMGWLLLGPVISEVVSGRR